MKSSLLTVVCNGATPPRGRRGQIIRLEYLHSKHSEPNVRIGLPSFVQAVYHLPPRLLDLLEIACYVFAADRYALRGTADALEYHSWSRDFEFFIRVRDAAFWNNSEVKSKLADLLQFMTGDKSYSFTFKGGHDTPQVDLFDNSDFELSGKDPTEIVLFSGGLDSLAGTFGLLKCKSERVCLVSHRSGQPETAKTQEGLYEALNSQFPNRIKYYRFNSGLTGKHAKEETQRTRSFLFSSVAFALAHAHKQDHFCIYENGVTSMNLPRREDLKNARASRTTHPKTIALLQQFFSEIDNREVAIRTPFFWKTKTEVVQELKNLGGDKLLTSSVSCSRTFQRFDTGTHCGMCYQCIDRRFAVYASSLDDQDNVGLYNTDFVSQSIPDSESKSALMAYVQQAREFAQGRPNLLYTNYLSEISEIIDYVEGESEEKRISAIIDLCRRHGKQVWHAIDRMRTKHDDPSKPIAKSSLLYLISTREHLKEPVERLIEDIVKKLDRSIPIAYRATKPQNENRLNDTIQSILSSEKEYFDREYPAIPFALCKTIPDHSWGGYQLLLETKYLRGKVTLSKITNEIGADQSKYPKDSRILFVLYDPERKIFDDVKFASDIENRDPRCSLRIIR